MSLDQTWLQTPKAEYAAALDRFQPMLHNYRTQGKAWQEYGMTAEQVPAGNQRMAEGLPRLDWRRGGNGEFRSDIPAVRRAAAGVLRTVERATRGNKDRRP